MNKNATKFSMKRDKRYLNKWKKIKNKLYNICNYFHKTKKK